MRVGEHPDQRDARDVAVVDVGSNSVRLVQFRVEGRALWPVFNEKTMAGLGKGATKTGRLNPEGVEIALRALKRFPFCWTPRASWNAARWLRRRSVSAKTGLSSSSAPGPRRA